MATRDSVMPSRLPVLSGIMAMQQDAMQMPSATGLPTSFPPKAAGAGDYATRLMPPSAMLSLCASRGLDSASQRISWEEDASSMMAISPDALPKANASGFLTSLQITQ